MKTSRPIRARISPAALLHNYRLAKQHAPQAKAWAVVKADAYGHGLWRAVQTLRNEADGFALLETENGIALREAGVSQPILLLEGIFSLRDARAVVEYDLTTVVHCAEQLKMLLAAVNREKPLKIYLKLNTGMNRLGFTANELPTILETLRQLPQVELTLMTHFAEADGERGIAWQEERFKAMLGDLHSNSLPLHQLVGGEGWGEGAPLGLEAQKNAPLPASGVSGLDFYRHPIALGNWPVQVSLANSAAILRHPASHADWVRPGIMLYGASPFAEQSASSLGLQPVMALESAIIGVQSLVKGDRVGYGGSFTAERPMRIGIVACGYADGYPRHAPSGTPIAVMGQRTATVGRVSMDMLACDLTEIAEAGIGSPVTLWGPGLAGEVPADEVASAAGTIAYELFCALAARVPVELHKPIIQPDGAPV